MLPGGADDIDQWVASYEDAKALVDDIQAAVQERNLQYPNGGPQASRVTAQARRKLGSLGAALDSLQKRLEGEKQISEAERNRRRNLVTALRTRREQLQQSLKRGEGSSGGLLGRGGGGGAGGSNGPGQETEATAGLDNKGLLQLQEGVMRQQDTELEALEKTVTSTRHIALAVNEELTLHSALLEELDEEVDVTHGRMRQAQKRLRHVMKKGGGCKCSCMLALLLTVLVAVVILAFKIML